MKKTFQLASFCNRGTGEVRHLLIDELDGHAQTDLILLNARAEGRLFSGTEYEVRQKTEELGRGWEKVEGFERAGDDKPPFESLEVAINLAMRLGHSAIYDPRLKQTDLRKPNRNLTGFVELKNWPGMQAKNGGSYRYAVKLMGIMAEPQLPRGFHPLVYGADFPQQMLKVLEAKKSIGPSIEFLFAGMVLV
jgi:hypothetical protein